MSLPPPIPAPGTERVRCAFSGVEGAAADMLQIGGAWVAPEHKDAAVQWLQEGGALRDRERQVMPGLGETARQANGLIRDLWRPVLGVLLCLNLPFNLADAFKNSHLLFGGDPFAYLLLFVLQSWLCAVVGGMMMWTLSMGWSLRRWSFAEAFGTGVRRSLVLWIGTWPGLIALLTVYGGPWGIYASVATGSVDMLVLTLPIFVSSYAVSVLISFSGFFVVDRQQGLLRSLGDSFRLVMHGFWRMAGYVSVNFGYLVVSYAAVAMLVGKLPDHPQRWILWGVAEWVRALPQVWFFVFIFALYKGLLNEARAEAKTGDDAEGEQ